MTLTADTLDFRMATGLLQRAYAWGGRARAVSPTYEIVADSMDVLMPEQRLREVRSVGQAVAESRPDTARIRTEERDWMRGDTIIGQFEPPPASDTTGRPRITELVARGGARSFYHIASGDSVTTTPAINYVTGGAIRVAFENQEVDTVVVTDQASGVYLTPATVTDTAATPRDTTGAARPRPSPARPGGRP